MQFRLLQLSEGLESGKTNALLNFINYQPNIDKRWLYAKDLYKLKYQLLINKDEQIAITYFKDPYFDSYDSKKKRELFIVFHNMIVDVFSSKTFQLIVTELFVFARTWNISIVFISKPYSISVCSLTKC